MGKRTAESINEAVTEGVIPDQANPMAWTKKETADEAPEFAPAEWIEPAEGTVIEGTLMRAFVIPDQLGGAKAYRAAYVVADAQGNEWTFGEKAAFKKAIREQYMGIGLRITFLKKERMVDPKTKKLGAKSIWRCTLETQGEGVGEFVLDALKKSHAELVARGEDVPF